VVYPHAVVYDFEAYLDKTKCYNPTANLTYENTHVPIQSATLWTANRLICNADPKALIASFMDELSR